MSKETVPDTDGILCRKKRNGEKGSCMLPAVPAADTLLPWPHRRAEMKTGKPEEKERERA